MSSLSVTNKICFPRTVSRLAALVDAWMTELSPAEFKVAAFLYRRIEQHGGVAVRLSAREIAADTRLAERTVEAARKVLATKGVIHLTIDPRGSWYGFLDLPAASTTEEPGASADPSIVPQVPAPQAGTDDSIGDAGLNTASEATPATSTEVSTPPEAAAFAEPPITAAPDSVQKNSPAKVAEPASAGTSGMVAGPPVSAAPPSQPARGSAETAEAISSALAAEPAKNADPHPAPKAEAPKSLFPATAARSPEDRMTAALGVLFRRAPKAGEIQKLQKFVPANDLLVECLEWMARNPLERFRDVDLLAARVSDYCRQDGSSGGPISQFQDERRRRIRNSKPAPRD